MNNLESSIFSKNIIHKYCSSMKIPEILNLKINFIDDFYKLIVIMKLLKLKG